MTAITPSVQWLEKKSKSGIRPFDISRDLRPVAELIAEAFSNELDPGGNAILREMRMMSHVGGLLGILNRTTGEFDDIFRGFVWVEEDMVYGNVTIQRSEAHSNRWHIANVAVAPEMRGRGIGRTLLQAALVHIKELGGRWALLQVDKHNQIARHLYEHMGFEPAGGQAELRLDILSKVSAPEKIHNFHSFSVNHWRALYDLACSQYNSQVQRWRSIQYTDFQVPFEQQMAEWFWRISGRRRIYRRCIQSSHRLEAALILTAQRWRGIHKIQLWVRPENYGLYETSLLQWTLETLQEYPRWPVRVTLDVNHTPALKTFQEHGFYPYHTLLTMQYQIKK